MAQLPFAPVNRILRKAGAEAVSRDAVEAMREAMEEYAKEIAEKAIRLAKHAGRITAKKEDVFEAVSFSSR